MTTCIVLRPPKPQTSDGAVKYQGISDALKAAIRQANLSILPGAQPDGNIVSDITESFIEFVHEADVVIADVNAYDNKNDGKSYSSYIYYLIGIAHALGDKSILVASDLNSVSAVMQLSGFLVVDGHEFRDRFEEMIKSIEKPRQGYNNPVQKYRSRLSSRTGPALQGNEAERTLLTKKLSNTDQKVIFNPIRR